MVLTVHFGQQGANVQLMHPYIQSFIQSGARGVQLFYMISAFTLCYSYNHRSAIDKSPLLSFYTRRFFRIAPLFYLAVIYYLWQEGFGPRYWLGDAPNITPANIAGNFVFLHSLNPYWINSIVPGGWSVSIEVIFYALFPFIFERIKNVNHACAFIFLSILIKAAFILLLKHHPLITDGRLWSEFLFLSLPNQLPAFGLGILLYHCIKDANGKAAVSPVYLILFCALIYIDNTTNGAIIDMQLEKYGMIFFIVVLALKQKNIPFLFNKAVYYTGDISYSIYLVHFAVIHFLNHGQMFNVFEGRTAAYSYLNFIYNFSIGLFGCLIAASFLHYTIELPFQNYGKKLIKKFNN